MTEPCLPSVEAERHAVISHTGALRGWERQEFRGGGEAVLVSNDYSLLVVPERKQSPTHCLYLAVGRDVPPLFERLPCGLLSRSHGLESVGRTDLSGCMWLSLSGRPYSLRFVDEVHSQLDAEILLQLHWQGDRHAEDQLRAAADDERLPHEVNGYLAECLSLIDEEAGDVEVARLAASSWREEVPVPYAMSTDTLAQPGLPPNRVWGLTDDGRRIAIDCPIEDLGTTAFPYGCALVEYVAEGGHVVCSELMVVERNARLGRFQGRLAVSSLRGSDIGGSRPDRCIMWEVRDDTDVWDRISVDMADRLFAQPEVSADHDLLARLSRLRLRLIEEELVK